MKVSDYLKILYGSNGSALFHNVPSFVSSLFIAGGCNYSRIKRRSKRTEGGEYEYKIYGGQSPLSKNIKEAFNRVNIRGLVDYLSRYLKEKDDLLMRMEKFGVREEGIENKECFFTALAMQFELFITSDKDDVEGIVCRKYNDLVNQQKFECDTVQRRKMQKNQYRYSLVIYEDDIGIRQSLISQLNEINVDESEGYTLDIFKANVATDIIRDSRDRDIDAYIIDLSRPLANQQSGVITDYSFSGKDLVDDLLRLKYEQMRMGNYSETAFFIYSSIPAAEVEKMFDFGISSHAQGLSDSKWSKVFNSIKVFALDKRTYTDKAVSRRVKAYFDERYNIDFLKNMEK